MMELLLCVHAARETAVSVIFNDVEAGYKLNVSWLEILARYHNHETYVQLLIQNSNY